MGYKARKSLKKLEADLGLSTDLESPPVSSNSHFKHVRRMANKLVDLLANQRVNYIENRMEKNWQELPQNRLKANFYDQADEDRMVFWNRAMEVGSR